MRAISRKILLIRRFIFLDFKDGENGIIMGDETGSGE